MHGSEFLKPRVGVSRSIVRERAVDNSIKRSDETSDPISQVAKRIMNLLQRFTENPMSSVAALRALIPRSPAVFCQAATNMLTSEAGEQKLYEPLWQLFLDDDRLLEELVTANRACDLDRAVYMIRGLSAINDRLSPRLVNLLKAAERRGDSEEICRILTVLGRACEGATLVMPIMILIPLINSADARIRSKAILLLCKMDARQDWLKHALLDDDPRVRANAIEATWESVSATAVPLLRRALGDEQPRVVGNAAIALLRLNDPEVTTFVESMGKHPLRQFRATAAWVMGRSGRSAFLPAVKQLLTDKDPLVFRNALRANVRL